MANLFSNINLDVPKSPASSLDLKLLDATCNHQVLNEILGSDSGLKFAQYDGGQAYGDGVFYGTSIAPDDYFTFTTKLPLGNNYIEIYETPTNDSPLVETFTVPTNLSQTVSLTFPPIPNSVMAQQKTTAVDYDGENEILYFPFGNYILSQLYGIITFTKKTDIGSVIEFTYTGDKKQIFQKNKDNSINWEIIGYTQNGLAVIKVYGRAFTSSKSFVSIKYFSSLAGCTRCMGKGAVNDLDISPNTNQFYFVYDFSKLIQDFFKRFNTRRGSNPFDNSDGTQVPIYIGLGKGNPTFIDTMIRTEAITLVEQIRLKQNAQVPTQGISLAEQIAQINQLTVTRTNPTDVDVVIEIQSLSNTTAQIKTNISSI